MANLLVAKKIAEIRESGNPNSQLEQSTSSALPSGLIPVDVIEQQPVEDHVIEIVVPGNIVVRVKEHCSTGAMNRVLSAVRETFSC